MKKKKSGVKRKDNLTAYAFFLPKDTLSEP